MGNDEILLVHFLTPLNRYDEELFFLIQKQQNIEKIQLDFFVWYWNNEHCQVL